MKSETVRIWIYPTFPTSEIASWAADRLAECEVTSGISPMLTWRRPDYGFTRTIGQCLAPNYGRLRACNASASRRSWWAPARSRASEPVPRSGLIGEEVIEVRGRLLRDQAHGSLLALNIGIGGSELGRGRESQRVVHEHAGFSADRFHSQRVPGARGDGDGTCADLLDRAIRAPPQRDSRAPAGSDRCDCERPDSGAAGQPSCQSR